jgi:hypothetical protein
MTKPEKTRDMPFPAVDGLLLEMGRNGTGRDDAFMRDVMDAVRGEAAVKPVPAHNYFKIFRLAASLAAVLSIVSAVIFMTYGNIFPGKIDNKYTMPCILVCSPGGMIKSGSNEKAIFNGMNLNAEDTVNIFKSKSAFVRFSCLSSMEIGAGSTILFNNVRTITDERQKLSATSITLKEGVIQADISGLKDGDAFTVATAQGVFMTQKSSFILIGTPELCFMEVREGIVRFKAEDGQLSVLRAGQSKVIKQKTLNIADGTADSAKLINEYKGRLTLQNQDIVELLLQLTKKKAADICLREIIKKRNVPL